VKRFYSLVALRDADRDLPSAAEAEQDPRPAADDDPGPGGADSMSPAAVFQRVDRCGFRGDDVGEGDRASGEAETKGPRDAGGVDADAEVRRHGEDDNGESEDGDRGPDRGERRGESAADEQEEYPCDEPRAAALGAEECDLLACGEAVLGPAFCEPRLCL